MFTHMGSLHQMHILVEFVTSPVLQWWPLTFQSKLLESFKISELVQPGESLRFLLWSPWEGGRVCPSTAYSWPFLGSTMISFVALMQFFVCGREHISYFSRLARMCKTNFILISVTYLTSLYNKLSYFTLNTTFALLCILWLFNIMLDTVTQKV